MINPIDPKASNYQGYPTIDTMDDMALVFPGENTTLYYLDLTWAELLGAEQYHIQVSSSENDFADYMIYEKVDCAENRAVMGDLMFTVSDYFYRIRAFVDGEWTGWTDVLSFSGACLVDTNSFVPAEAEMVFDTTPLLEWDDAEEIEGASAAVSYQVQIIDVKADIDAAPVLNAPAPSYQVPSALTTGATYYWRVRGVNESGTPGLWSKTQSFTIAYEIGSTGPAGGLIFYVDTENDYPWTYLEAAPYGWYDGGKDPGKPWGGYGTSVGDTETVIGTGASNTDKIVSEYGNNEPYDGRSDYAAKICADLECGGYGDWFLPSKDDLNLMYENLRLHGVGGFAHDYYWSSSEDDDTYAWKQDFDGGWQRGSSKKNYERVRAVRAF